MGGEILIDREFEVAGGDFDSGGEASMKIKLLLKKAGVPAEIIRRVVIACYEAEMNVVMYAARGTIRLTLTDERIKIEVEDIGPGIQNIVLAMKQGYTTSSEKSRQMGFGAGMGLPNIKKNTDHFSLSSSPGQGTVLWFDFKL